MRWRTVAHASTPAFRQGNYAESARRRACAQAEDVTEEQEEEDETARLFRLAAEQLKEKREEEAMSTEERILKCAPASCIFVVISNVLYL